MTQQEKQTAEKLRHSSEYIKAAESFAKYAHKEWVEHQARAFFDALLKRMEQDDDEDE